MRLTLVLLRSAGVPALRRVIPLYLGMFTVAAVVFGPTGMHPTTVTEGVRHSWHFRVVLWTAWLLSTAPATRALLRADTLDYVRWLPVRPLHIHAVLGLLLLALQTPWMMLFAVGGGLEPALAALMFAAGVHAVIAIRPRGNIERVARLVVLLGVAGALRAPTPAYVLAAAGLGLGLMALPISWRRAPERHRHRRSRAILPGRVPALAQCYISGLLRNQPAMAARAAIISVLGAGCTFLLYRANTPDLDQLATFSVVVVVIVFTVAIMGMIRPIAETEQSLSWVLDSTGTSSNIRVAARLATGAVLGAVLGVIYTGLLTWSLSLGPVAIARVGGGAIAMAVALAWFARRAAAPIDGSKVVGAMIVVVVAEFVIIGVFGDLAALLSLAGAFAISWERS